jgi:Protein of unknown function (DUF3999)
VILRPGLTALALVVATPAFHAAAPVFRYERPVQLAQSTAPETCIVLPLDLLSHAAPWLQDLRVMAGDREIAYQVRTSSDAGEEVARPEQILNRGERNGAISFDVEMTEPRYSRVLLKMARSHFSVLVHVTGIDRPGEAGVAFPEIAYSSDTPEDEPQVKRISLPESNFRYLHFEIRTLALDPVTPQDIAGVEVLVQSAEPPRYVQVASATGPQQKPHETIYEFAVPANLPLDGLSFASDDPKAVFSRAADVERFRSSQAAQATTEDAARREMPMQSEGIALMQAPDAKRPAAASGEGTVHLALGAAPYASTVRLTIQNGDDAPLALHAIALQMRERQVCFLRKPNTSYALRYGDPLLGAPQYDLSPIEAAAINVSESTLGAERSLTPASESLQPFTERHPVLLWIALILVVATLGFVALRSARS